MADLVESTGELTESHGLESLAQCRVVHPPRRHRIAHHVPERADRQVGPLRQKEDSGAAGAARISPRPNGQMPAMARKSVLFPEPEAPPSSTVSPRKIERLTFAMSG